MELALRGGNYILITSNIQTDNSDKLLFVWTFKGNIDPSELTLGNITSVKDKWILIKLLDEAKVFRTSMWLVLGRLSFFPLKLLYISLSNKSYRPNQHVRFLFQVKTNTLNLLEPCALVIIYNNTK